MQQVDLLVIGGGPAGYAGAIKAAQLGKKVVLVEQDSVGGTCLNRGCIPTKSLLESAAAFRTALESSSLGLNIQDVSVDYPKVISRKDEVVSQLVKGLTALLKGKGIDIVGGKARFEDQEVVVTSSEGEQHFQPSAVLLATGTKPLALPGLQPDGEFIYNSDQLLSESTLPSSLVIVGGGVIGCEFATVFNSLGVDVTIVELTDSLIPTEDEEIRKTLLREFKKAKIKVLTQAKVVSIDSDNKVIQVEQKGKVKEISGERVLVSVGRQPVLPDGLTCELTDKGYVTVDSSFATSVPGVFAAGDIIGGLQLAHLAFEEGICAVNHAFGLSSANTWAVPRCVYTTPEVGCVGLTEEQARAKYEEVKVGKYFLKGNGKALIIGENSGFCKVVAVEDKVVGVHIIGPHATELIAEGVLAVEQQISLADWAEVIHPHPTVSESVKESVLQALGQGLHS